MPVFRHSLFGHTPGLRLYFAYFNVELRAAYFFFDIFV